MNVQQTKLIVMLLQLAPTLLVAMNVHAWPVIMVMVSRAKIIMNVLMIPMNVMNIVTA